MVLITRTVGIVVLDKFATQRSIGGFAIRFAGTASSAETKTESVTIYGNGLKILRRDPEKEWLNQHDIN